MFPEGPEFEPRFKDAFLLSVHRAWSVMLLRRLFSEGVESKSLLSGHLPHYNGLAYQDNPVYTLRFVEIGNRQISMEATVWIDVLPSLELIGPYGG